MSENNPDSLPTPSDRTGPCPWCGRISNFTLGQNPKALAMEKGYVTHMVYTLTCQGCDRTTVVVTHTAGEGLMWWPAPGAGTLDPQVNEGVASTFDEGSRCLSIGAYRAAAVMFRSSLSLFVKDKGSDKAKGERHLKSALKHMKSDGDLHKSLWDWADHLNQLGNEGAHPEDYDDITQNEAEGLGSFVRHLISHEYEMPAKLLRAQGLLTEGN